MVLINKVIYTSSKKGEVYISHFPSLQIATVDARLSHLAPLVFLLLGSIFRCKRFFASPSDVSKSGDMSSASNFCNYSHLNFLFNFLSLTIPYASHFLLHHTVVIFYNYNYHSEPRRTDENHLVQLVQLPCTLEPLTMRTTDNH